MSKKWADVLFTYILKDKEEQWEQEIAELKSINTLSFLPEQIFLDGVVCPSTQSPHLSFSHVNFPGGLLTHSISSPQNILLFLLAVSGTAKKPQFFIHASIYNSYYKFLVFFFPLCTSLLTFISTEPPESKVWFPCVKWWTQNFHGCHSSKNGTGLPTSPSSFWNLGTACFSFGKTLLEVCTHKLTRMYIEHFYFNFKAKVYDLLPRPLDSLLVSSLWGKSSVQPPSS